ncbi:hypothetical protein EPN44_12955 [bacterium]|nr:MAG: hypothetical protein EPN44_12955 [bacterium]
MSVQFRGRSIGREHELDLVLTEIESSLRDQICRVTAITGPAGIGKSTLQQAVVESLADGAWSVWRASCYEAQLENPYATLDRIVASGLAQLEISIRNRYVGGLEPGLTALGPSVRRLLQGEPTAEREDVEIVERAVARLLDGLLLDLPVLIVVDDAQWVDTETARVIRNIVVRNSASRLHVFLAERGGTLPPLECMRRDRELLLGPLDAASSAALVKSVYPDASGDVVEAIVAYSAGVPLTLLANAEQAERDRVTEPSRVGQSVAAICRRDLLAMEPRQRELLQLCAILQQPVEYRILRTLFSAEAEAVDAISRLLVRYLRVQDGRLSFVHNEILGAVLETIALPEPLHRQLLTILLEIDDGPPELMRRIAYHAHACAEYGVERRVLVELGTQALRSSNWDEAIGAYQRAVEIAEPAIDEYAEFYARYSTALRARLRITECYRVLERATRRAGELGLSKGQGPLANGLILAATSNHDYGLADQVFREMQPLMGDEAERLDLTALMSAVYAYEGRREVFEPLRMDLESKREHLSNSGATFLTMAEGVNLIRSGEGERAARILHIGQLRAESKKSFQTGVIDVQLVLNALFNEGCDRAVERIRAFEEQYGKASQRVVSFPIIVLDFMRGNWDAVRAVIEEHAELSAEGVGDIDHFVVDLMMATLARKIPQRLETAIAMSRKEDQDGRTGSAVLLGAWVAAAKGKRSPEVAERLLGSFGRLPDGMLPWSLVFGATALFGLALYGVEAGDKQILRWIARRPEPGDHSMWWRANYLLAIGLAHSHTGNKASGISSIRESEALFRTLGAVSLGAIAADRGGWASDDDVALLLRLGVARSTSTGRNSATRTPSAAMPVLSKRELEVAELVASGASNREIAATLFLSERTVEAHLASAFRKLDVSSRTQLTRWFVLQ